MIPNFRIGHGFDVHCFGPGEGFTLGGVDIPHHQTLIAHSDGDVLYHAICDAILGAAALGDIGQHFPDTDPQYRGISSRQLLRAVMQKVAQADYAVHNLDTTIVAQAPKLASYLPSMCACLSEDLKIPTSQINLKATTTEKLGYVGREEGIAAHAVVLLIRT